jgi:hypothetical protein
VAVSVSGGLGSNAVQLIVDAEKGLALFTLLLLIDKLVEGVEAGAGGTVDVVPPVADEVLEPI